MNPVLIECYSDPFSIWSWCNEPRVRKLKELFRDQIVIRHVMGGLFEGPEISQEQAFEIKTHWQAVQEEQRMPVIPSIWETHPPKTSLIACQAFKAAQLQGDPIAEVYLRRMREAIMLASNPLDEKALLMDQARTVPGLDVYRLSADFDSPEVAAALASDLQQARSPLFEADDLKETPTGQKRYAFPTLVFKFEGESRVICPFPAFEKYKRAIEELNPEIHCYEPPSLDTLLLKYPCLTTKEVEVMYQWSRVQALEQLESLCEERKIQKTLVGDDCLWCTASLVSA